MIISLALSVGFFISAIIVIAHWFLKPRRMKKLKTIPINLNTGRHLMFFTGLMLLSVWMLRLAVGLSLNSEMTFFECLWDSFLHALQTFSMDEVYTEYLTNGKAMITALNDSAVLMSLFSIYSTCINVIAPIAGGAFIFDILAGIFPRIRYFFSRFSYLRNRFYFTALNEKSLALAKSIVLDDAFRAPLIIFTDAYIDDEKEESSELQLSAKAMGAICLKDDLLHIPIKKLNKIPVSLKNSLKNRTYVFLSDSEETENLQTLTQLLTPDRQKMFENTDIYVFGTDKRVSNIEDEFIYLHNRISADYAKKGSEIIPDVVPFNGVRNISQRLFYELPLFEPLYNKERNGSQLNLTIVGSGAIGTEIFLNAYWLGQMLGVTLNINVVSESETKEDFIHRIDGINPEIMASSLSDGDVLKALVGNDRKNPTPVTQPVYFHFRYSNRNILNCDLLSFLEERLESDDDFCLKDTDYYVVAAGSDEENFLIADRLRQATGYYHLNENRQGKTVISYVIYNSELCRALNAGARQNHVSNSGENEFDVYMHAFGCMEDIYSVANILRSDVRKRADWIGENYKEKSPDKNKLKTTANEIRRGRYYNIRANEARTFHLKYKAFSADIMKPTLFNSSDDEEYHNNVTQAEARFAHTVKSVWNYPDYAFEQNALAWLEHRRWNAFMRINAFKKPDDMDKYIRLDSDIHSLKPGQDKDYQFLFIKRHPCIVECDIDGYPGIFSKNQNWKTPGRASVGPDELDILQQKLDADYKSYDYPDDDVKG